MDKTKPFFPSTVSALLIYLLTGLNILNSPANYRRELIEHTDPEIKLRKVISNKLKSNVQKFSILQAWPQNGSHYFIVHTL